MKDITIVVLFVSAVLAIAGGWIANIVKLYHMGFDPMTGEIVLRIVGIFLAPLGVVMGFV